MRYTETKLDKIVRIGMARIDQAFDKCCADLEALKYRPSERMERLKRDAISSLQANLDLQAKQRLEESARLQRLAFDISNAGQAGLVGQATRNGPSMWPLY